MKRDVLFALIQNPDLIPGIYNYCDGWCEKCSFTHNCLNYKMMDEGVPDIDTTDNDASSAMENLDEMFQLSMELMKQSAKDLGMEIPEKDENFNEEEEDEKDDVIFKSKIMKQADQYSDLVNSWFIKFESLLFIGKHSLKELLDFGDETEMNDQEKEIVNLYEIIRWYQFIIPSKLFRSLRSKTNTEETGNEFFQYDSIASGKVALLSLDSSIEAWTSFMNYFSELEDEMIPLLIILSGLRANVETEFSESREFVRPGFDI